MKFSVVIPTYNRIGTLRRTLAAATVQAFPDYEIIVVDDESSDGTPEMVQREFPSARLLRQTHGGPAAARNRGIEAATGDVIAFTDDDCLPPSDGLARLANGYARYPQVVGVGVRGIGRNYFEQLHGAGYPSRVKIALRVVRRLLDFPLDLWRMPAPNLALVKLAEGLITCRGQWDRK